MMRALLPRALAILTGLGAAAHAQNVDEAKVDNAIKKGVEFLKTAKTDFHKNTWNSDCLILWTLIHAGVPQDDARFKTLLDKVMSDPLEKTYKVALTAMCLEEIDRVKYQEKIAQCGQFLVDNQCKNGQWSYGSPTEFIKEVKVPNSPKAVASGGGTAGPGATMAKDGKPKVVQHVAVRKMKDGPDSGDNSNTQYAALGLRACFDSGVTLPEGVILLAVKWWRESQFKDPKGKDDKKVATGPAVTGKVEGWNYKDENSEGAKPPYHAMTAGGVSSLVIYDYMLDRKWKDDSFVKAGMNWLTVHFEVPPWNTYYLYGLERAAILYGTEKIGDHFWYAEGANALLNAQHEDGSWGKDTDWFNTTWDTCFSVLFLRRATRALVATGDSKLKK